jgi:hypothetical protein
MNDFDLFEEMDAEGCTCEFGDGAEKLCPYQLAVNNLKVVCDCCEDCENNCLNSI